MSEQVGGRYPTVFSPIRLGPVEAPNRIFMAPHGIPLEVRSAPGDLPAEPALNRAYYFGERAAGGVGLIIHSTQVLSSQTNFSESPSLASSIPAFRRVAEEVHKHGSKIFAEIWYVNWIKKAWEALGPEAPALAPSALQNLHTPSVRRAMTRREIQMMTEAYARSTRHLREAGYDGIELHISHGSLVEYFLSPYFNHRTDEYGGSLENRARFAVEILQAIKQELSPTQALGLRINADELLQGGLDEEATKQAIRHLCATGLLDFLDIDISVEPEQVHLMTTGMFDPVLHNVERVRRVREAAGDLPVLMTPGRLTDIADAEQLLASGAGDMIGAVRGLIADPQMVNKARDGRDRERRVCVAVNTCVDVMGVGWGCAINPVAGRENRWGAEFTGPTPRPQRVVVVGAGPAGLEAARIAAERGNKVTLLERRDQIGGGVRLWGLLPGRESMRALPGYFGVQLDKLGVEVRTGVGATAADILALAPEVVIVATGSVYNRQGMSGLAPRPIPGADLGHVLTPDDIIGTAFRASGKVIVIDDEGYHAATGIAEMMARDGAEVVYVTRKSTVAASLGIAIGYIYARLQEQGVRMLTSTRVKAITRDTVQLASLVTGQETVEASVTSVVLSMMRQSVGCLEAQLEGKAPYLYVVGDALAPRGLREAIYEGHRFGRLIGEKDMPASVSDELFRMDPEAALISAGAV